MWNRSWNPAGLHFALKVWKIEIIFSKWSQSNCKMNTVVGYNIYNWHVDDSDRQNLKSHHGIYSSKILSGHFQKIKTGQPSLTLSVWYYHLAVAASEANTSGIVRDNLPCCQGTRTAVSGSSVGQSGCVWRRLFKASANGLCLKAGKDSARQAAD